MPSRSIALQLFAGLGLGVLVVGCTMSDPDDASTPSPSDVAEAPPEIGQVAEALGAACTTTAQCGGKACIGGHCFTPNRIKDGTETDVDCGGANAPKCAVNKTCAVHADCASDGCDDRKKCVVKRSCAQERGGRTCGTGEVGKPGAVHESCCIELPLPGRTTKLDKYKVTAGRMRQFTNRVNGNVLGWYDANKASLSAAARAQIEPFRAKLPTSKRAYPLGSDYQLGGTIYLGDRPSDSQGCYVGTANDQGYGSHTFWNGDAEGESRGLPQALLDTLPLNCVPYPLAAAFCAWDGGRLQTVAENNAAYGTATYPWGNTPNAGGYADVNGNWTLVGPATKGFSSTPCPTCDDNRLNWRNNYQMPAGGNPNKPWDLAYFISAPGRFPLDSGPAGHKDIAGDLMELTATAGPADAKYGATVKWSRAGSWEGHAVGYDRFAFPTMTKYGKVGLRCARD